MSDSQSYRRALLAGPRDRALGPARPVGPGGAALHAAVPVLYAPDAVLAALGTSTVAAHELAVWVVLPVSVVLVVVLLALRQVRRAAGPDGDVALVRSELGQVPGVVAAAALLVDHVLLLAVAVTAAGHLLTALVPGLLGAETWVVLVLLAALGAGHLGPREPRTSLERAARLAVGGLVLAVALVVLVGAARVATGTALPAAAVSDPSGGTATGLGLVLVLARAVTAGTVVLAGVSTSGAGSRPAGLRRYQDGRHFLLLGLGAVAAFVGLLALGGADGAQGAAPVVHRVATAALGTAGAAVVALVLTGALLLAAALAVRRVPDVRPALLGRDPIVGERPAHRPVTVVLALAAMTAVVLGGASVPALVPAYVLAVLVLLALGQLAGARRWRRTMERHDEPAARRAARRARSVVVLGATATLLVLALALGSGLSRGSWIPVVAIGAVSAMMWSVRRHRRRIEAELALEHLPADRPLPTFVRAVVVVTRFDRVTMRAVAYARAARSGSLAALTVPLTGPEAAELRRQWLQADLDVPLVELAAPLGDRGSAVAEYVRELHAGDPHCLVAVYLPEVLAGSGPVARLLAGPERRLRRTLLRLPRTTVTTVPWRLGREDPPKES